MAGPLPRRPGSRTLEHFDRKIDGETWLAAQTIAVATGAHVVPRLSRITVQAFYDDWSRRQVWASGTRTAMDLAMRSSRAQRVPNLARSGTRTSRPGSSALADQPLAAGNDQDPLQQRARRLPRGGPRPAHRTRPDRSSPAASSAARRRQHDDPEHRGRRRCLSPLPTTRSALSPPSARSPASDSARPRRSRSPTSTSCADSSP